jgi:hypothetical protein
MPRREYVRKVVPFAPTAGMGKCWETGELIMMAILAGRDDGMMYLLPLRFESR